MNRLHKGCVSAVSLLLAAVFLYLAIFCICYTSVVDSTDEWYEHMLRQPDVVWTNLLALLCFALLLWLVDRVCGRMPVRTVIGLLLVWTIIAGTLWVLCTQISPRGDAGHVRSSAAQIIRGDFSALTAPDGYLRAYPFQLGYVMLSELTQRAFGIDNMLPMQLYNVLALAGLYGAVLALVWQSGLAERTQQDRLLRRTALLLALCVQPILYCSFQYGNLLSACCGLWAAWCALRWFKGGRARFAVLACVLAALCVLWKPNGWLIVIALTGTLFLCGFARRRWQALALALCLIASPMLLSGAVQKSYALRANTVLDGGVPMIAHVAMGLQEGPRSPGWFNQYNYDLYLANGHDGAAAQANAYIAKRVQTFLQNPAYALSFFHTKLTVQWNETTFESLWVNRVCRYEEGRPAFVDSVLSGGLRAPLEHYMDWYTSLLYLGLAAGLSVLVLRRRKQAFPLGLSVLVIIIFGALMYHMLSEAKSQYLFVYLPMMAPFAAFGLWSWDS
ncbi:MAG: hypothetical protein RR521_00825 [Clostridia bacterium]